MTQPLKIAIAGCAGRMGRQLLSSAITSGHVISGGSEAPGSQYLGQDLGLLSGGSTLGVTANAGISEAARDADVWIDFTVPKATLNALPMLSRMGVKGVVIGTTGFSDAEEAEIVSAAADMAIVKAGNFSLGVNVLEALVRQAAARLVDGWDIEVLETHHRRKVDAPSGTALMLGEAAAEGRGGSLKALKSGPYDGPQAQRETGQIGFSVRRMGDVIGEHEVAIGSDLEIISLTHKALDRSVFANGAIKAAEWTLRQEPGLYDMSDVIGLG